MHTLGGVNIDIKKRLNTWRKTFTVNLSLRANLPLRAMFSSSKSYAAPIFCVSFMLLIIACLVRTVAGILQALCQCMIYIPALVVIIKVCQTKKETMQSISSRVADLCNNPIIEQTVSVVTKLVDVLVRTLNVADKTRDTESKRSL